MIGSLNRAQSAHALNSTKALAKEDGLKRVSSEPLLSGQEKGALLKRKLSFSEQDTVVCEDGRNKHKKQGGKRSLNLKIWNIYCLVPFFERCVLCFCRKYKQGHETGLWNSSREFDWRIRFWVLFMYEVRVFSLVQYFHYRCLTTYLWHMLAAMFIGCDEL